MQSKGIDNMKNILVTRSSMPTLDEYIDEIKDIWETHWLTNMGAKHKELQKKLLEYLGVEQIDLFIIMDIWHWNSHYRL